MFIRKAWSEFQVDPPPIPNEQEAADLLDSLWSACSHEHFLLTVSFAQLSIALLISFIWYISALSAFSATPTTKSRVK
jgi:hypothetical protein